MITLTHVNVSANGYGEETECISITFVCSGDRGNIFNFSTLRIKDKILIKEFSDQLAERLTEWNEGKSWVDVGQSGQKRIKW